MARPGGIMPQDVHLNHHQLLNNSEASCMDDFKYVMGLADSSVY